MSLGRRSVISRRRKIPGVIWTADAERAGPSKNPFLEWVAYSGGGTVTGTNAHPYITVVKETNEGALPLQGKYMYRYEMIYANEKKLTVPYSPYGDRLEMGNEKFGEGGYESSTSVPKIVSEWTSGTEQWMAFAWMMPTIQEHEVSPPEGANADGCLPIAQFHPEASGAPFMGLRLEGTNYLTTGKEKPHFQVVGTASLTSPANNGVVGGTWYRFIYHIKIHHTEGFCEAWIAEGKSASFTQFINSHSIETLPTGDTYVFPCQGGPREEGTQETYFEEHKPPTSVWYMDGWTFGTSREAVTLNAFGKSE